MKRKVLYILSLVTVVMLCTMCTGTTQTVESDFYYGGYVHVSPDAVAEGDKVTVQMVSFSSSYHEETLIKEIDYLVDDELKATSSAGLNYVAVIKTKGLSAGEHTVTARIIPKKDNTVVVSEIIPGHFTITE